MLGRWPSQSRTHARASSSEALVWWAAPESTACVVAPPSSSMLTSSPVTARMTSGPVMNMCEVPSTMTTASVIAGE